MDLLRRDMRPSHVITREALENAIASVAATGGSTNGVLHLLAIAYELGIPLTIDDFDRIAAHARRRQPQAGGRFVATDIYEAGGVALVARELVKRGLVHADAPTSTAARSRRSPRRSRSAPGRRSSSRSRRR